LQALSKTNRTQGNRKAKIKGRIASWEIHIRRVISFIFLKFKQERGKIEQTSEAGKISCLARVESNFLAHTL